MKLLGVIFTGVAIIALLIASQFTGGGTNTERLRAGVIADDFLGTVATVKNTIQLAINSNIKPTTITFDTAPGTGLFAQNGGFMTQPRTIDGLGTTQYLFKTNVTLNNIGSGNADWTIAISGVSEAHCRVTNTKTMGSTYDAEIPASGVATASWTTAETAIDLSSVDALDGHSAACVTTTDGDLVLFGTIRSL